MRWIEAGDAVEPAKATWDEWCIRVKIGLYSIVLGLLTGYFVFSCLIEFLMPVQQYVLTEELDAAASYRFESKADPPLKGVLEPGTKVEVGMRKGSTIYLKLHTAIHEDDFLPIAERIGSGR